MAWRCRDVADSSVSRIVEQQAAWFDPVFTTGEQRKHFREYVTGLIAGDKVTVTAINNLFLGHNDQSALNRFLTLSEWDEADLNRRRVQMELARLHRRPVNASGAAGSRRHAGSSHSVHDGLAGLLVGSRGRAICLGT